MRLGHGALLEDSGGHGSRSFGKGRGREHGKVGESGHRRDQFHRRGSGAPTHLSRLGFRTIRSRQNAAKVTPPHGLFRSRLRMVGLLHVLFEATSRMKIPRRRKQTAARKLVPDCAFYFLSPIIKRSIGTIWIPHAHPTPPFRSIQERSPSRQVSRMVDNSADSRRCDTENPPRTSVIRIGWVCLPIATRWWRAPHELHTFWFRTPAREAWRVRADIYRGFALGPAARMIRVSEAITERLRCVEARFLGAVLCGKSGR